MMNDKSRLKLTDKKVTCGSPNLAFQHNNIVKTGLKKDKEQLD